MSEELQPITAREAAAIITGQAATEASQGYEAMEPVNPVRTPEPDALELKPVLEQGETQPGEIQTEITREYKTEQGDKLDENLTLSKEQAAHDLAEARRGEDETLKTLEDMEIARATDALRAGQLDNPPEAPVDNTAEAQHEAVMSEAVKTADIDPEIKAALENPKIRNSILDQVSQGTAQAEQAVRAFAAATAQNAVAATAALVGQFPELNGVPGEQVGLVIRSIAQKDPNRAAEIVRSIENVRGMVQEAQRAQLAQNATAQYRFKQMADAEDQKFDSWARTQVSEQALNEISRETRVMLREYGLSEQDINAAWESNPAIRSFAGQRILMDAVRWRQAHAGAKAKAVKPVPVVQHPGSPSDMATPKDYDLRALDRKLANSTGRAALRAADVLLTAKRARR